MWRVLFLLLAACVLAALADSSLHCGSVFDGQVRGVDIDLQQGNDRVFASWTGFEDGTEKNRVLRYEWAVISENVVTESVLDGGCRSEQGFRGHPDVLGWQNADTRNYGQANVGLSRGATYFVVIRATTSLGIQKYTNSNGFTVDENIVEPVEVEEKKVEKETKDEPLSEKRAPSSFATAGVVFNSDCPIDQELLCEASKVSVGEFLTSIYGPPEFSQQKQANIYFTAAVVPIVPPSFGGEYGVIPDDDDDDNGGGGSGYNDDVTTGSVIGIAIGITALCCFLVIFIILLSSFLGKGSNKFKSNVHRQDNVEEF